LSVYSTDRFQKDSKILRLKRQGKKQKKREKEKEKGGFKVWD